jgi:hypothetical protein
VDAEVAVELLSSIKRDGNYAENMRQIQQNHLRVQQQQNVPAPVPAAIGRQNNLRQINHVIKPPQIEKGRA